MLLAPAGSKCAVRAGRLSLSSSDPSLSRFTVAIQCHARNRFSAHMETPCPFERHHYMTALRPQGRTCRNGSICPRRGPPALYSARVAVTEGNLPYRLEPPNRPFAGQSLLPVCKNAHPDAPQLAFTPHLLPTQNAPSLTCLRRPRRELPIEHTRVSPHCFIFFW